MPERPEFSLTGWETESIIEIPLPDDPSDIDENWCDAFNAVYGDCAMRTMVHVTRFRREVLDGRGLSPPGPTRFDSKQFIFDEDDALDYRPVIGRVSRMMRYPIPGEPGRYQPHLGLIEVVSAEDHVLITKYPHQEFLIPIENHDSLILYS